MGSAALVEAAAGTGTQWSWNLNSLYDPDLTFAGGQPLYFDQLLSATGPYQRYLVRKVQLKLTCTNMTTNSVLCAFYAQPGPVDLPSKDGVLEKPRVRSFVLSPNTGGLSTKTLRFNLKISQILGIPSKRVEMDDVYSGLYNANPSQIAYGVFMAYSMPPSSTVATVSVVAELTFKAQLYGLVAIGRS